MKKIVPIIIVTLLFVTLSTYAQGDEAQMKKRIAEAAQALTSMQCDFVQTKQIKMLNDKLISQGRMCYSQKDKLRWEYLKPYQYVFIMNGDRVLLKNKEHSDVINIQQNKLFREIARVMMSSVMGSCLTDNRTFKVALQEKNGEWAATLIPQRKDMKQMFQRIVLHFDQRQATVCRVELLEKNGDMTTIDLKNIRKNETIALSQFTID